MQNSHTYREDKISEQGYLLVGTAEFVGVKLNLETTCIHECRIQWGELHKMAVWGGGEQTLRLYSFLLVLYIYV